MRVLVIVPDSNRAALVAEGLAGVDPLELIEAAAYDETQAAALAPDVVIVVAKAPDRQLIAALRRVSLSDPRPVAMFVETSEPGLTQEAIRAGVAAYVVDGLAPRRLRAVIDVAMSRFALMQDLQDDLHKAREDLATRRTVDQAKALLMRDRGLTEDEAHKLLRKLSMDTGRPLGVVATDFLTFAGVLKGDGT